jgi:hypothetical protein
MYILLIKSSQVNIIIETFEKLTLCCHCEACPERSEGTGRSNLLLLVKL